LNKDKVVDWVDLAVAEADVDRHTTTFVKIFRIGETHKHLNRCKQALTTKDRPPPAAKFLFKDHKKIKEGEIIPPTRPMVSATEGPLHRASIVADKILEAVVNELEVETGTESRSTEEVKRRIYDANKKIKDKGLKKIYFFSQDVKALYPSLTKERVPKIVRTIIQKTKVKFTEVDWKEAAKYLKVNMTEEDIDIEGFRKYVPKFALRGSKKMTYLDSDTNAKKEDKWDWTDTEEPTDEMMVEVVAKMMEIFVEKIMQNHYYQFEGQLYHQVNGGPIGLLVTGTLARLVMLWWDLKFLQKLETLKISPELYFRYVDDEGLAVEPIEKGTKYEEGRLTKADDEQINSSNNKDEESEEQRTARIYREIADSIEDMIKFEEDITTNHVNKKIPVLDLQCWVDNEGQIRHSHYKKPMASTEVVANKSAIANKMKRTILEEEALRRLRNFGIDEPWADKAAEIEVFNVDMEEGGYPTGYRATIITRAVMRYENEVKNHKEWEDTEGNEGKVLFRTGEERRANKEAKIGDTENNNWFRGKAGYTSTIKVPSSKDSKLADKIKKKLEVTEGPKGTKPKVVEGSGTKMINNFLKTNHQQRENCERKRCHMCAEAVRAGEQGSKGRCYSSNLGYYGQCRACLNEEEIEVGRRKEVKEKIESGEVVEEIEKVDKETTRGIYHGESSRTAYGRILEHFNDYRKDTKKKNLTEDSWMKKHFREDHKDIIEDRIKAGREECDDSDFKFGITGTFRKPTERILNEAARGSLEERGTIKTGEGTGTIKILATKNEFHLPKDVRIIFHQL
jgi:hypothetical protein